MTSGTYCLRELAPREVYLAFVRYRRSGGLLPLLFTLTPACRSGLFSVALSGDTGLPDISRSFLRHGVRWCSDFPFRLLPCGSGRNDYPKAHQIVFSVGGLCNVVLRSKVYSNAHGFTPRVPFWLA